jgi:DmsE family decaheme c-type cytochrome
VYETAHRACGGKRLDHTGRRGATRHDSIPAFPTQEHAMPSRVKTLAGSLLAAAVAVAWLALPGAAEADRGSQRRRPPAVTQSGPPPAAQPSSAYAGEETCLACHEGQTRGYHRSAHGRASNPGSPSANRGCESCHGPGQDHVDASGDTSKIKSLKTGMSAAAINAQCLDCHSTGKLALWEGSQHDALNVSCASCHSIHAPKSDHGQLKADRQVETCEPCHRRQVQKLRRSSHMPVDEGKLECSSCHNPHGAVGVKLLKTGNTVNETCASCHAEKRGPFLWEHAPVTESCTTCHDAHGTTNDRMLVAKEPFLCQRCHVSSQHPDDGLRHATRLSNSTTANRMSGRSCAACHQNVHGSNAPSGKAFLR